MFGALNTEITYKVHHLSTASNIQTLILNVEKFFETVCSDREPIVILFNPVEEVQNSVGYRQSFLFGYNHNQH